MCSACWRRGWGTGRGIIWGEFGVLGGRGVGLLLFFFWARASGLGRILLAFWRTVEKRKGWEKAIFCDEETRMMNGLDARAWVGGGGLGLFGWGWVGWLDLAWAGWLGGLGRLIAMGRPCIFRRLVPSFAVISSVHVTACYLTMVFYSIFIHTISLMSTKVFFRLG